MIIEILAGIFLIIYVIILFILAGGPEIFDIIEEWCNKK